MPRKDCKSLQRQEMVDLRLTTFQDTSGSETQYFYSNGLLDQIIDPAGKITDFSYTGNLLTKVTFPDNTSKEYIYNSKGQIIEEINQKNDTIKYEYNQWDRISKLIRPDGTEIQFNDAGTATVGNNFTNNSSGELTSTDSNALDGITDARGVETSFERDINGFVSTIIDGEGQKTTIIRDTNGSPIKITRPDNTVIEMSYDPLTRDLIKTINHQTGIETNLTYNQYGDLLTRSDSRGVIEKNVYDPNTGNLLSKSSPLLNQSVTYEYFDLGLLKSSTNSQGETTSSEYDNHGNLSKNTDPLGLETLLSRDASGNITQIQNAKGQVISRSYDLFNRLTEVVSPKNESTSYHYSPTGDLLQIIDPLLKSTLYEYNSLNQLIKKVDPLGKMTLLEYDHSGNISKETDPSGNIKTFIFDKLNRLTKKSLPDNTYNFTYNSRSNITEVKDNNSIINYTYKITEKGDLVSSELTKGINDLVSMPQTLIDYDFDQFGNKISTSTPAGNFSYSYDLGNRLTSINNHKNENFTLSYDNLNRLTSVTRPGSSTNFTFDSTNFLTKITHLKNIDSSIIQFFEYGRDSIGNKSFMRNNTGLHLYNYDDNNQLTSATSPNAANSENFSYDSIGNRITDKDGQYLYEQTSQQLKSDSKFHYSYDDNGNLVGKTTKDFINSENYIYDSQNRLIAINWFSNNIKTKNVNYFYDALGRRVKKEFVDQLNSSKNFTQFYNYDGNELLSKYNQNGELLATYTHSFLRTDDVLAVDITAAGADSSAGAVNNKLAKNAGSYFYIKDSLGSIESIVGSDGTVVQHYVYSAFGKILRIEDGNGNDVTNAPPITPYFTYTGREFDSESGLYYYRARYYNPSTGRFLTSDPHPGQLKNPITFNSKYIYANNNPVNLVDPNGKFAWGLFIAFGLLQAMSNYDKARKIKGASDSDIWFSTGIGFLTGGFSATAGGGPLLMALQIGGLNMLHTSMNQLLFTGKVDMGLSLKTGLISSVTGYAGARIGGAYDLTFLPGTSAWIANGGAAIFNDELGASNGIPVSCQKGPNGEDLAVDIEGDNTGAYCF